MIRIGLKREDYWLDLALGVRVKVRPLTSPILYAAQAEMSRMLSATGEAYQAKLEAGDDTSGLPDLGDRHTMQAYVRLELTRALAHLAILEWEGVAAADSDAVAEITPENINDLFDLSPDIFHAFEHKYQAAAHLLEAEKNASGPALNGTGVTGRNTAKGATKPIRRARGGRRAKTGKGAPTTKIH